MKISDIKSQLLATVKIMRKKSLLRFKVTVVRNKVAVFRNKVAMI